MFVDFAATREQCFTVFLRIQKVFVKDTSWPSKTLVVTQHMQKIETLHSALSLFYTPLTIHWWNHVWTVVIKKVSWSTSCFQPLRYSVWYCLHVCIQCCTGPQTISPSEATTSDCIIDQLNTSKSCRGITSAPLVQIHNGVHWQNIRGNTAAEKLYSLTLIFIMYTRHGPDFSWSQSWSHLISWVSLRVSRFLWKLWKLNSPLTNLK